MEDRVHALNVGSWDELQATINTIQSKYGSMQVGKERIDVDIIFRGQADSDWALSTTLERQARAADQKFLAYMDIALSCAPQIDSFTGKQWRHTRLEDIETQLKDDGEFSDILKLPCVDFLVYLRHHGFPSPLLDWTRSYEIASFFAFRDNTAATHAAVYAYIEMPNNFKNFGGGELPFIWVYDPVPVKLHKRHLLQKCVYSMCTVGNGIERQLVSHEKVFAFSNDDQDLLIKIVVPRKERLGVLADLHKKGINDFALFSSDDSLMKTLAFEREDVFPRK